MRPSKYNVLAPTYDNAGYVLFNTKSSGIAVLSAEEGSLYERFCAGDEADEVRAFGDQLSEAGFALEDPSLEQEYLRYLFEQHKFNSRVFEMYVATTLDCNYQCVYCFEHKRKGKMTPEVEAALVAFVREQYDSDPFKVMKIGWYGGEPLLCIDSIERLSNELISFCEEKGVEYWASVVTNAALLNDEMQKRLLDCQVWCITASVSGGSGIHDAISRPRNGKPAFETVIGNLEGCIAKGFAVDLHSVVEQSNAESSLDLMKQYSHRDNFVARITRMKNNTDFDCHACGCSMRILDEREFAALTLKKIIADEPTAEDIERLLRPLYVHCPTTIDRGYVIDDLGNAYSCGSVVNMEDEILFNIVEPPETRKINMKAIAKYGNENPFDYPACAECFALPLCQGGCTRERLEKGRSCTPYKFIIKDLLTEYSRKITSA